MCPRNDSLATLASLRKLPSPLGDDPRVAGRLVLRWRVLLKSFKALTAARAEAYDLPLRWVWTGSAASAAATGTPTLPARATPTSGALSTWT